MAVISEYVKYYSNVSFSDYKFNEIDSLIFSLLSYLDLNSVKDNKLTLPECYFDYEKKINKRKEKPLLFIRKIEEIFKNISLSERYKNIILGNFVNDLDHLHQFAALSIYFEKTLYISYRGTDETLIGWKDNFESSYIYPTKTQSEAVEYINKVVKRCDKRIILGGHSKGGHLAIQAAMKTKPKISNKIEKIYNFDGPGFLEEVIKSNEYKNIKSKIINYYPSNSTVGMLMQNPSKYKVVQTSSLGFRTHDACTWNCFGGFFVESKLDKSSKELNTRCNKWLKKYTNDEKEKLVKTLFAILDDTRLTTVQDLLPNIQNYIKLISKLKNINENDKKLYITMLKELLIKVHDE